MSAAPVNKPIVHFVGSIPLPDAETSVPYPSGSDWTPLTQHV